jgi:hypothetical protein
MRALIIICIIFFSCQLKAQEIVLSDNLNFDFGAVLPNEAITIANKDNSGIAIFYKTNREIYARFYNAKREHVNGINQIEIPRKTKNFIGQIYKDNLYTFFFSNDYQNKFSKITINLDNRNFKVEEDIDFKIDRNAYTILGFIEDKSSLIALCVSRDKNVFKTYSVFQDKPIKETEFSLESQEFISEKGHKLSLLDLVYKNHNAPVSSLIQMEFPSSLEATSSVNKLYFQNEKLIITNNIFPHKTIVFNLDFTQNSIIYNEFLNTDFSKENKLSNFNSFVFKDKLLTVHTTNENLKLNVLDLKTKELIKEHNILEDEEIYFKNTPIILEGGDFSDYREVEKTSKFLRKINYSNLAISATTANDSILITIGASKKIESGLVTFGFIAGGLAGGIFASILTDSFSAYTRTKSVRITGVFDKNFNHISGKLPLNEFDKINILKNSEALNNSQFYTVFKENNDVLFGNFDKKTKLFTIYKM